MLARIYDEMLESVAHLDLDTQARVILAYAKYQVYGELPDSSDQLVYSMVKAKQLDLDGIVRDINSSRDNGKAWGRKTKTFQDAKVLPKEEKHEEKKWRYLDFVQLTDDEYSRLVGKLWESKTQYWIHTLNDFIGQIWVGSASKKYKSHYFTILNWSRREWGKTSHDYEKEQVLNKNRERIRNQINQSLHPNQSSDVWVQEQVEAFDRRGEISG